MSHVKAYICDHCNELKKESKVVGITMTEDMFDRMKSYPTEFKNPAKSMCHYCLDCYRKFVIIHADRLCNRKKDERGYELKLMELAYSLREKTVKQWRLKKKD